MIDFLKKIWKWVRTDGLLHIGYAALIFLSLEPFMPWWVAAIITVVLFIIKEIYDRHHGGCAEWHDIICDCIGLAYGIIIFLLKLWLR